MSGAYAVLHDPEGLLDAELPLDRAPHEALVTAVLAWKDPDLAPCDYEQIALQLTGHARAVAADVRRLAAALPKSDGRGALAELILREADGRLAAPAQGHRVLRPDRARLVQALYTRLDRLPEPAPVSP
ncbi:restriction endonuclease [Streptomyces albidoflavus]|uniref:restriction endonuclease n=1 Tax=Streptomyces albidoflavus TaxID=1886 RepID=UPI003428A094